MSERITKEQAEKLIRESDIRQYKTRDLLSNPFQCGQFTFHDCNHPLEQWHSQRQAALERIAKSAMATRGLHMDAEKNQAEFYELDAAVSDYTEFYA
jgi:Ulp1 family protease